jgi:hypothetical protein
VSGIIAGASTIVERISVGVSGRLQAGRTTAGVVEIAGLAVTAFESGVPNVFAVHQTGADPIDQRI